MREVDAESPRMDNDFMHPVEPDGGVQSYAGGSNEFGLHPDWARIGQDLYQRPFFAAFELALIGAFATEHCLCRLRQTITNYLRS